MSSCFRGFGMVGCVVMKMKRRRNHEEGEGLNVQHSSHQVPYASAKRALYGWGMPHHHAHWVVCIVRDRTLEGDCGGSIWLWDG